MLFLKKRNICKICGVSLGFAGFTVEVIAENSGLLSMLLRSVLIFTPLAILMIIVKKEVLKESLHSFFMFIMYVTMYMISSMLYEAKFIDIANELILLCVIFSLYILVSNRYEFVYVIEGIYLALLVLVTYYFLNINFASFLDSEYRLSTGLNSNGIGAITIIAFIHSLFKLQSNRKSSLPFIPILLLSFSIIVICATKSRTSLLMLLMAALYWAVVNKKVKLIFFGCFVCIIFVFNNLEIVDAIFRISPKEGYTGDNSLYNLTGRTFLWSHGISVIKNNILFGVGPENAFVIVDGTHKGTYHNAFIQTMVTVGVIGFLPILIVLTRALINLKSHDHDNYFKVVFIIGLVGSMAESRLLNYGSPGNLLFLISILVLSSPPTITKEGKSIVC